MLDLGRLHRQPMIGLGARQRRRALDRVETVHLLAIVGDAAPGGEVTLIAHAAGAASMKSASSETTTSALSKW